ncbi:nicotinate-nucleotide--dimethylbenzimidazole phosphoribosyltransferase [Reinekea marinisedimentorum]|uniref:Nicotinate-nucleotide--dimethylbenzimidazole phosphoribosyltransferase n=1 Tax=Reinekea marinisedimentorum TaxID=230495 RepID=A0A4R3I8D4_9GAMM|nr:nicotinate-nucleotide--dimethylbenzimidazole phosphoribosyltransferase [Reinekea marinisedimentorum]TCS41581.1 nicotinate-nucleotide--dimethylbenzimidazole phosphoribosyltransferase [Reinekea marinisedimentorum]
MTKNDLKIEILHKINNKTKPPGSLGQIEEIALQVGMAQKTEVPKVDKPQALVFGADHGVCAEGVNPFPQKVTELMMANFSAGGAAMNVFCRSNDIPLQIVNLGIVNPEAKWPNVLDKTIAAGTKNLRREPAMSMIECERAMAVGEQLARDAVATGCNLLIIGEMGIGNTTSASALLSALTAQSAEFTVGPGTGASPEQIETKITVINEALKRCQSTDPLTILAEVGGFEIAAMVGVLLTAEDLGCVVMVDGFISTAAALVAFKHQPSARDYWLFSHASAEPAHQLMIIELDAKPILNLSLHLGEGTGAALAYPLVKCAVAMLNEMATFQSAGIITE